MSCPPPILSENGSNDEAPADSWLIGVAGFEPATTRTPSVCATSLRHTPTPIKIAEATIVSRATDSLLTLKRREVTRIVWFCSVRSLLSWNGRRAFAPHLHER